MQQPWFEGDDDADGSCDEGEGRVSVAGGRGTLLYYIELVSHNGTRGIDFLRQDLRARRLLFNIKPIVGSKVVWEAMLGG